MKEERLNNLMIHKEHTDELDLKLIILSLLNSDQHRCAFFGSSFTQNGWVWLGGCGFGLTTLKELAPGLVKHILYIASRFIYYILLPMGSRVKMHTYLTFQAHPSLSQCQCQSQCPLSVKYQKVSYWLQ